MQKFRLNRGQNQVCLSSFVIFSVVCFQVSLTKSDDPLFSLLEPLVRTLNSVGEMTLLTPFGMEIRQEMGLWVDLKTMVKVIKVFIQFPSWLADLEQERAGFLMNSK